MYANIYRYWIHMDSLHFNMWYGINFSPILIIIFPVWSIEKKLLVLCYHHSRLNRYHRSHLDHHPLLGVLIISDSYCQCLSIWSIVHHLLGHDRLLQLVSLHCPWSHWMVENYLISDVWIRSETEIYKVENTSFGNTLICFENLYFYWRQVVWTLW